MHKEVAPILQVLYTKSLMEGEVPDQWKTANVAPIYKKGPKTDPANYRPISLTCILCKTLEHIVASTVTSHFNKSDLFTELQHGFREKRSFQTQLINLVEDLLNYTILKIQTDLILLDFSKAFDKVNHEKLLYKLHFYGIRGETLTWIKAFLDNRTQSVILNGEQSDTINVASGVPQALFLVPFSFSSTLMISLNTYLHPKSDSSQMTLQSISLSPQPPSLNFSSMTFFSLKSGSQPGT